jgi:hypothetical protein
MDLSDLTRLIDDTDKIVAYFSKSEAPVVELTANEYKNDVQEIIQFKTGTLRRSVHVEMRQEAGHPVGLVGTDQPQARRLEKGFVGRDSLGRIYHQTPQPRWGPAYDQNLPKYERMMQGIFVRDQWESDVATFQSIRPDLSGRI